jgi:hypothetical protein
MPQLTNYELMEFEKTGRLPEAKNISPLPGKEAVAEALGKRYGGRPIGAEEILDIWDWTQEGDADQSIQFQAWRDCRIDWYEATLNSAGQVDYTSIHQLPF